MEHVEIKKETALDNKKLANIAIKISYLLELSALILCETGSSLAKLVLFHLFKLGLSCCIIEYSLDKEVFNVVILFVNIAITLVIMIYYMIMNQFISAVLCIISSITIMLSFVICLSSYSSSSLSVPMVKNKIQ